MKYPKLFFLILLPVIFANVLNAQTLVKIPFVQNAPFVVLPEVIYKSFENNASLELGLETQINGGSGNYTFSWTKDGSEIGTDPTLVITEKGSYVLSVDDGQGCASLVTYYIDTNVGVISQDESSILVYPNPAKDIFFVESTAIRGLSRVEVYSMDGILRMSYPVAENNSGQVTIDASSLPAGNYLVVLSYPYTKITKVLAIR